MSSTSQDYSSSKNQWRAGSKLYASQLNDMSNTIEEVEKMAYAQKSSIEALEQKVAEVEAKVPASHEDFAIKGEVDEVLAAEEHARTLVDGQLSDRITAVDNKVAALAELVPESHDDFVTRDTLENDLNCKEQELITYTDEHIDAAKDSLMTYIGSQIQTVDDQISNVKANYATSSEVQNAYDRASLADASAAEGVAKAQKLAGFVAGVDAVEDLDMTQDPLTKQIKDLADSVRNEINDTKDYFDREIGTCASSKVEDWVGFDPTKIGQGDSIDDRVKVLEGRCTGSAMHRFETAAEKVDTLVGDDADKSARAIAAEEVAKVVADAPEDFDTLKEVADWIKNDTTGAAKTQADVSGLKTTVGELKRELSSGVGMVSSHIQDYVEPKLAELEGCIDTNSSELTVMKGMIGDIPGRVESLEANVSDMNASIVNLKDRFDMLPEAATAEQFNELDNTVYSVQNDITQNSSRIQDLQDWIDGQYYSDNKFLTDIASAFEEFRENSDTYFADKNHTHEEYASKDWVSGEIELLMVSTIAGKVSRLENVVGESTIDGKTGLLGDVDLIRAQLGDKSPLDDTDGTLFERVAALETKVSDENSGLVKDVSEIKTYLDECVTSTDLGKYAIVEDMTDVQNRLSAIEGQMPDGTIGGLEASIGSNTTEINLLKEFLKYNDEGVNSIADVIEPLKGQVEELDNTVYSVQNDITQNSSRIQDLQDWIDGQYQTDNKFLTDIASAFEEFREDSGNFFADKNHTHDEYALKSELPVAYDDRALAARVQQVEDDLDGHNTKMGLMVIDIHDLQKQFAEMAAEIASLRAALAASTSMGTKRVMDAGIEGVVVDPSVKVDEIVCKNISESSEIANNTVAGKLVVVTGASAEQLVFEII